MILTPKKDSKVRWEKKELETLAMYAIVAYLARFVVTVVAFFVAMVDLDNWGYHFVQDAFCVVGTIIVGGFCGRPLVGIWANHHPDGKIATLKTHTAKFAAHLGRKVEHSSFIAYICSTAIGIVLWTLVILNLQGSGEEDILLGLIPQIIFEGSVVVVAALDLFTQALILIGAWQCDALIDVPSEYAASAEESN